MSNSRVHKIPILSFFSGGGFMDLGFEKAGFEIVWTNEYDQDIAKLHAEGITAWRKAQGNNRKAEIFNTKSISEIKSSDIREEAFQNILPKHFGIIGGPPCQDFTLNGKLNGFNGERGKMTIVFFEKILELKPTFFVMENVTGLINRKESRDFLNKLLKNLEKEYLIDFEKLNALEFGVPQQRKRVFFVGIRKKYFKKNHIEKYKSEKWFEFPINSRYKDAAKKYNWGKRIDFGTKLNKPQNLPLELCVSSCLVPDSKLKTIPNANEFFQLKTNINKLLLIQEGDTNRFSFKRLHRYKYSPTACYGNNEVHLHPFKNRRLSVREALRIQGVPDEYVLPFDFRMDKKFKMIGNGVPVPLAEAVANAVITFLNSNKIITP